MPFLFRRWGQLPRYLKEPASRWSSSIVNCADSPSNSCTRPLIGLPIPKGKTGETPVPPNLKAPDSSTPLPLTDVPPLVLSEIMRDIDLFVGGERSGSAMPAAPSGRIFMSSSQDFGRKPNKVWWDAGLDRALQPDFRGVTRLSRSCNSHSQPRGDPFAHARMIVDVIQGSYVPRNSRSPHACFFIAPARSLGNTVAVCVPNKAQLHR